MAKSRKNEKIDDTSASLVKAKEKNAKVQQVIDASVISDIPVELANNLTLVARRLTAFLSYY